MDRRCWYVLGLRYISASKTAEEMESAGFECFVPPKITNLLFVHSEKEKIDGFMMYESAGRSLHYMRSLSDGCPIVVPDKDMLNFILVCRESDVPIVMRECPKVKIGDRVRVIDGPLKGVEGNVVRMRKQKRILVAVSSILWVATAYVRPELLEIIT